MNNQSHSHTVPWTWSSSGLTPFHSQTSHASSNNGSHPIPLPTFVGGGANALLLSICDDHPNTASDVVVVVVYHVVVVVVRYCHSFLSFVAVFL